VIVVGIVARIVVIVLLAGLPGTGIVTAGTRPAGTEIAGATMIRIGVLGHRDSHESRARHDEAECGQGQAAIAEKERSSIAMLHVALLAGCGPRQTALQRERAGGRVIPGRLKKASALAGPLA
jgi:hypothetical protein